MIRAIHTTVLFSAAAFMAAVATFVGCSKRPADATVKRAWSPAYRSEQIQPPLRSVIAIDESGSMSTARVAPVEASSLAPLFERLESSGGELAVSFITDDSNAPLLRVYVPSPPEPVPVVHGLSPTRNIFTAAAEKKAEDDERARYGVKRRAWRAEATAKVNAFAAMLARRLERAPDAPRTDIRSALVRANLFLAEPTTFTRAPKNIVVLITDGIDNMNTLPPPAVSVPSDLLLVNGNATVAYLTPLHPICFESVEAALRFAVVEGGSDVRR